MSVQKRQAGSGAAVQAVVMYTYRMCERGLSGFPCEGEEKTPRRGDGGVVFFSERAHR